MANFKFFQDQLREKSNGKYSSKKVWGAIIMTLICLSFTLDGLKFYTANESLFNSMLIAGCTLLGLTSVKEMVGRKNNEEEKID